jgi:excinuclease ABC subunit B
VAERDYVTVDLGEDAPAALTGMDLHAYVGQLEKRMREAAGNLEFEEAARLRDEIKRLEDKELGLATERRPSQPARRAGGAAWKPSSGSRDDKRRAAQAKSRARRRVGP